MTLQGSVCRVTQHQIFEYQSGGWPGHTAGPIIIRIHRAGGRGDLRSVKCQTVLQCLTSQGGPRAINIHIGQHRTEGKYDLSQLVCQVVVVLSNVRDKYLVDA